MQQENLTVNTRDTGDQIGAAVFNAVMLGVQQFHVGDGQMEQVGCKILHQPLEYFF